jgi:hypothetical protein
MTNEHNKKPNVTQSVAFLFKRLEERLNITETRVNAWFNELEGLVKGSVARIADQLSTGSDSSDEEDEDDE